MKNIAIRVYRPDGTFLSFWDQASFEGFTKNLNGGLGPCSINLGKDFNYEGSELKLNNRVDIAVTDKDTSGERVIYSGYISRYVPFIGREQGIEVTLLGYQTKLAQDIWQDTITTPGTNTTTFDYSAGELGATDIGTIFRDLMDRYQAEVDNPRMMGTNETIETTGTTTTYKFEMVTYREAIDILKRLAPANWWWYVDEDGLIYLQSSPSSATHEFILGKHFSKVRVERSLEKLINAVLFFDGSTYYKLYTDASSISDYGKKLKKMKDSRAQGATDADKMAENYISEHKDPQIKVEVEIIDNNESDKGYDIEDISPGDTCNFRGFDESYTDIFRENMLITKVDYKIKKAIITVEPMKTGIIRRTEEINKRVDSVEREGVPTDYTT